MELQLMLNSPCVLLRNSSRSSSIFKIRNQVSWCPPPTNYHKVNFDGSKLPNGQASFGFVIRDFDGKTLLCGDWRRCSRFVDFYSYS